MMMSKDLSNKGIIFIILYCLSFTYTWASHANSLASDIKTDTVASKVEADSEEDLWKTKYYEFTVPEYDLTERALYGKLIDATLKLDLKTPGGWEKERDNYFIELSFWTRDSVDYYGVFIGSFDEGTPIIHDKITGYAYHNGRLIYIVNHNDTVLKLKEPVEERTFQFKSIIAFYDPPLYIFRKEGSNARFLESIID